MLLPVFVCWLLQPIFISPFRSKTAPAAGQRLEPSFIGRARGNSDTRSLVPSVAVSFRSNPRSASLGTG